MKKLLLTLGLIGCTLASALAQGTINFGNTVAGRVRLGAGGSVSTATDGLIFGIFYGAAGSSESALTEAAGTATLGEDTPGVMTGASAVVGPGIGLRAFVRCGYGADVSGLVCGSIAAGDARVRCDAGGGVCHVARRREATGGGGARCREVAPVAPPAHSSTVGRGAARSYPRPIGTDQ